MRPPIPHARPQQYHLITYCSIQFVSDSLPGSLQSTATKDNVDHHRTDSPSEHKHSNDEAGMERGSPPKEPEQPPIGRGDGHHQREQRIGKIVKSEMKKILKVCTCPLTLQWSTLQVPLSHLSASTRTPSGAPRDDSYHLREHAPCQRL